MPTTELPKRRNSDERAASREHESRDESTGTDIGEDLSKRRTRAKIEDNRTYADKDKECCSEQFSSIFKPVELFPPNLIAHWSLPSVSHYLKRPGCQL